MNFVSKLTLFSSATLLAMSLLSGCGSTNAPVLSDNPATPGMSGTANANGSRVSSGAPNDNKNNSGTAETTGSGMSTGPVTGLESGTGNVVSIPAGAARFQAGETVNIGTSTGSDAIPGPISTTPQSYLIADDGTISLPFIGTVQAAGKTPGELQRIITRLYVPEYFIRLAVTVTAMNRVYYVGGEVTKPGPEEYLGQTTVTKAVQSAGDFTMFANHRVWLNRSDGTHLRVDVDKALRDADSDPAIFPGDQIQVPRRVF
jgi:protein involved in polysaccharide export with SLBB domain